MTAPAESDGMLPGLADLLPARPLGLTEAAAVRRVRALHAADRLGPDDELVAALVLELASALGRSGSKAAGAAMLARQLIDAIELLPRLEDAGENSEWGEVVRALAGGPVADEVEADDA